MTCVAIFRLQISPVPAVYSYHFGEAVLFNGKQDPDSPGIGSPGFSPYSGCTLLSFMLYLFVILGYLSGYSILNYRSTTYD
jgi:hypothetical protein